MTSSISFMGVQTKAAAGNTDPYWANVVLLAVNDNAGDGTTSFADQSSSAKTITAIGNTQYDTAQAPTGMTSSGLFDGTNDALTLADSADWDFGTSDFTVELMVRFNANAAVTTLCGNYGGALNGWSFQFRGGEANEATLYHGDTVLIARDWGASTGVWYHYAVARNGSNLMLFADGAQLGTTATNSTDISGSTASFRIGELATLTVQDFNGWMACLRITKGVARYTANFTPPTLPLPTS